MARAGRAAAVAVIGAVVMVAASAGLATPVSAASPENEAYVAALYSDVLNREPSEDGLEFWAGLLDDGASRGVVAGSIFTSREGRANQVVAFYDALLGREVDASGFAFFLDAYANGALTNNVLSSILGSGEYFARAGGTFHDWATALYEDLLRRTPSPTEANYWAVLAAVHGRGAAADSFLRQFETAAHMVADAYGATNVATIDIWNDYLGRDITGIELQFWAESIEGGVSLDFVLVYILSSIEYFSISQPQPE